MNGSNIKITAVTAYQMGRVDALDGSPATRFSGKPTTAKVVGPGEWGCTKYEAANIEIFRAQYAAGYKAEEANSPKIVAFARQLKND